MPFENSLVDDETIIVKCLRPVEVNDKFILTDIHVSKTN